MDYVSENKNKKKPTANTDALVQQGASTSQSNFHNVGAEYGIQPSAEYIKLSERKKNLVDSMTSQLLLLRDLAYDYSGPNNDYFDSNPQLKSAFKRYNVKQSRYSKLYPIARQEARKIASNDSYKNKNKIKSQKESQEEKLIEKMKNERKEREYMDAFNTIWSTNAAYKAIKSMSAGNNAYIDTKK